MKNDTSISISARSFVTSVAVLATLMLAAGILTRVIPSGSFERTTGTDGAAVVVPGTWHATERPDYPVWRWATAPLEVLTGGDGALAIVIIVFIAVVGGAFSILTGAGILEAAVTILSRRFRTRRKALLAVVCLFFMAIGSFMGIFEEVVPLIPVAVALSLSFGWDVFAGLGMSILATGFGFSAAIANPFSIGTAQRLAGVPVMSGSLFRIMVFGIVYAFYLRFMFGHVEKLEAAAGTAGMEGTHGAAATSDRSGAAAADSADARRGVRFFAWSSMVLAVLVFLSSVTRIGTDYVLPVIALGFLVIGSGSGLSARLPSSIAARSFVKGALGVLPAGLLILMALAVKHIIVSGGIMDTVLHRASGLMAGASPYGAAAIMYLVVLGSNFFIGSASAKAFLLMPILTPLADLSGVSRQVAVQAFAFGDGFSNMLYPTNAVLLISLGLAGMSYGQWFRRTWKLQVMTYVLTMVLLLFAVAIGYR